MAKKKEVKRNYHFSDGWLITLCNRVIVFILRDIVQFTGYGVNAAAVDDYRDQINTFEEFPTDIELAGTQRTKTEEKNAAIETEKTAIRAIMARVSTVYAPGTPKYDSFGTKGMDQMTDSDTLLCGRRVARMATENLAALAGTGLTALIITDLTTKCQAVEDAIAAQEDAIAKRDIATQSRIELGNAIYDKLMNLCGFGQAIWADIDEAKYNDYVIYNTSGGLVNPVEMTIDVGITANIANKLYVATDVFEITSIESKLEFGFCVDETTPVVAGVIVSAGETKSVTASELGDFAVNQFLNCTNNDTVQGSFIIKLP